MASFSIRIDRRFLLGLALLAAALISYAIVTHAQTTTQSETTGEVEVKTQGITFPVPELGNCGSKDECRRYCDDSAHLPVCIKFAEEHGLMNKEEASRARMFSQKLQAKSGPGGCQTPRDCQAFCSDLSNIDVCVKFAEEHGLKEQNVEDGKKISGYLKSGGQMPGGCTSKESCAKYCGDFSHAQECFEFAQKAGLAQVRGGVPGRAEGRFEGGIPPGQFQKFLEAVKNGGAPGGCKSKDECERYCNDQTHREECIAFGEKAGFIEHNQAEMIRKSGGTGPGGCNSPEACKNYCADQTHHEECYKFAEEHGFLKKEDVERAKEGFVQLRTGLEQAPPEVAACLKSVVGPNVIEDIQSGTLTPGPEIGDRVRGCFEKFGHKGNPRETFHNAPPEVLSCAKEKLGDVFAKVQSGQTLPTPEIADTFRICFQKVKFIEGGPAFLGPPVRGGEGGQHGPSQSMFYEFLRSAPPQIVSCLQEKFGDDYAKLKAGEIQPGPDFKDRVQSCFEEFRSQQPRTNRGVLSPEVIECVKNALGPEAAEKLQKGETGGEIGAAVGVCLQKYFKENPSKEQGILPPAFIRPPQGTVCAQVITPAQDPATGVCKTFPTPCEVPPGWKTGCGSTAPGGEPGQFSPNPTELLKPFVQPFVAPSTVTPSFCGTVEECKRNCFDSSLKYFGTPECIKFRESVQQRVQ